MAYTKTAVVTKDVTTATAVQYNSLMAEVKAAMDGIPTHDVDMVLSWTGNQLDTITATDNSPAGDAGFDVTRVTTITWVGGKPTSFATVFSAGEMNITMTEAITWSGNTVTAIGRTLS
jgi:Tfp pilus assembly protein PilV